MNFTKTIFIKKILILFCFSLLTIQLIKGQKIDTSRSTSPQALHDMYWQKRKTNYTVGVIILGSGIGMTIGKIANNLSGGNFDGSKGLWLFYLGGAATLISIPFFISARSNERKAKLALKGESVTIGNKILVKSNYSALALTIQLSGLKRAYRK